MYLRRVSYRENQKSSDRNVWELDDLLLNNSSLIVGKNATGKSRTVRVIHNLAIFITQSRIVNGEWEIDFETLKKEKISYYCYVENAQVQTEKIVVNGITKLDRNKEKTIIYSNLEKKDNIISPPPDKLVLHIRRDEKEYPFLELLYKWAENTYVYTFSRGEPTSLSISPPQHIRFSGLELNSTITEKLSDETWQKVKEDFNSIGYEIEEVKNEQIKNMKVLGNIPMLLKALFFREKGLQFPIAQFELSEGMYRAFTLLVIIHYLLQEKNNNNLMIIIDDLGANLDYERSTKLAKLLFDKLEMINMQLIATTNDKFLINAVDIKNLNILTREGGVVKSTNYENSKEKFDQFALTGLSNFDLFSSDFLKK